MRWTLLIALVSVAGCETSTDPADGGFFNGVSGIATGSYKAQNEQDQADVAAAQARNAALADQIAGQQSELAQLKVRILNQRNALGRTDAKTTNRINAVLGDTPSGDGDAETLAALQKSIADARALSEDLAKLSG